MATPARVPELIEQKLAVFEGIQAEFEGCFHFVQMVHSHNGNTEG